MTTALVLTVIGEDRPGLVESLSQPLTHHEANWLESRMASLAGSFAGILLDKVPEANADALINALQGLESQGLQVMVRIGSADESAGGYRSLSLNLVGQDHPDIVHEVSHALASRKINIDEFSSECTSASWSGETLFHAAARLRIPQQMSTDELREVLEGLANELMVDITLDDVPAA
jgi:glycine cleavage system regulatory protein